MIKNIVIQIRKILKNYLHSKNSKVVSDLYSSIPDLYSKTYGKIDFESVGEKDIRNIFNKYGIILKKDFLTQEEIVYIKKIVNNIKTEIDQFLKNDIPYVMCDKFDIQKGDYKFSDALSIEKYGKCLVTIREAPDEGMIDIFNFEKLLDVAMQDKLNNRINELRKLLGIESPWRGFNIYINKGIQSTRGFHADSYNSRIKGFVYLSDVNKPIDGPYTFILRNRWTKIYKAFNKLLRPFVFHGTESTFFDKKSIIPVYGKTGDLIISDQSEPHRGLPQGQNGSRTLIVFNSGF